VESDFSEVDDFLSQVEDLEGEVPLPEILNPGFIASHTAYPTFDDLLEDCPHIPDDASAEELGAELRNPSEELEEWIAANTSVQQLG